MAVPKRKSGAGHKDTAPLFESISNVTIFVGITAASFESCLIQRRRSDIAPGCSLLPLYPLMGTNESGCLVTVPSVEHGSATTFVILAGGSSRRFGTDKALARVPGTGLTMLESMIQIGTGVCDQILVVGTRRFSSEERRVLWIDDRFPGEGPLGGLVTASGTGLIGMALTIGVDQPYAAAPVLQQLVSRSMERGVPICFDDAGIVHPLPVAMNLPAVAEQLKTVFLAGERSLRTALWGVGLQTIAAEPDVMTSLTDVDRPVDFLQSPNSMTEV